MRLWIAALAVLACLTRIAPAAAAPGVTVTLPPHPVGTVALHLRDTTRDDPFMADRDRELMVSVFYPATSCAGKPRTHYLSAATLPEFEEQLGIELPGIFGHACHTPRAATGTRYPVVLYSPAAGTTRLMGTGLAEDLASRGYVVVTIDHTYEASPAVEFPHGRLVQPAPMPGFTPAVRTAFIDARLADIDFVLDSLTTLSHGDNPDAEQRRLPDGLTDILNLDRVGIVGHSSGGYTAVESLHRDPRIDAAVNLDGQLGVDEQFGSCVTEGTERPVLVITSEQIEHVGDANPSLDAFWSHSTGWKQHLALSGAHHYDFTDMPLLVPAPARAALSRDLGPIGGKRASTLVRAYVTAMFDKFLREHPDPLLDTAPTADEITVIR